MKKLLIFLVVLPLIMTCMCGCPSNNGEPSATVNTDEKITTVDGVEVVEFGEKEAAKYLLQVDINPSLIIGYAGAEEVYYIASNNADGFAFLQKHETKALLGQRLDAVFHEVMTAAHEDGYDAEGLTVDIHYASEEPEDPGAVTQMLRQGLADFAYDAAITVEDRAELVYDAEEGIVKDGEIWDEPGDGPGDGPGDEPGDGPGNEPGNNEPRVCDDCNGTGNCRFCDGVHAKQCSMCGGTGELLKVCQGCGGDLICALCEKDDRCRDCTGTGKVSFQATDPCITCNGKK